jgi:hypothetical protein
MKCIDNELIQRFIDCETTHNESTEIKKHLAECADCVERVEGQRSFSSAIKMEIETLGKYPQACPDFIKPAPKKEIKKQRFLFYKIAAAAACISFVFYFFQPKQTPEQHDEYLMCYVEKNGYFDANKLYSQQKMDVVVIDGDGVVKVFSIGVDGVVSRLFLM